MKLLLCTAFSLLLVMGISAQPVEQKSWTLEECVRYALENNIQVKGSALQAQVGQNNLETAKWDYAPDLNGRASYGWNFGLNIDPVTNQISQSSRQTGSFQLSSNWVLYNGGRLYNTIARNNHEYLASLYDLEDVKNDISLNVAGAYLEVLLNKEIFLVAQEQARVTQLQVDRTSKLVKAGSLPQGDLYQLQAQLARDEQNRIGAQNAVLLSKLALANLLQLENPDNFEIADPEIAVPDAALIALSPGDIFATAVTNQPAVKAATTRIEGSEEGIDISQSGYLPTLSLTGAVSTSYSDQILVPGGVTQVAVPVPTYDENGDVFFTSVNQTIPVGEFSQKNFSDQIDDNINEYVGINLSVPLFNKMRVKNNVQNSRIAFEQARLSLEAEKNALRQTIYKAHADARASYNSYLAAQKAVEASEESFGYAQQRFQVGSLNQFDYENAKNSLAAAKSDQARAKYNYIFSMKVLEFYLTNQVKL